MRLILIAGSGEDDPNAVFVLCAVDPTPTSINEFENRMMLGSFSLMGEVRDYVNQGRFEELRNGE